MRPAIRRSQKSRSGPESARLPARMSRRPLCRAMSMAMSGPLIDSMRLRKTRGASGGTRGTNVNFSSSMKLWIARHSPPDGRPIAQMYSLHPVKRRDRPASREAHAIWLPPVWRWYDMTLGSGPKSRGKRYPRREKLCSTSGRNRLAARRRAIELRGAPPPGQPKSSSTAHVEPAWATSPTACPCLRKQRASASTMRSIPP